MNVPKSSNKKIRKLSNILVKYAEQEGVEFCFGEEEIYPLETFAHFGGLSLFLIEAKENYEKIYNNKYTVEELMAAFGRKTPELTAEQQVKEQEYLDKQPLNKVFPIEFMEQEEETYFGFVPVIKEDINSDFTVLAHFAHYTVEEYIKIYKKNKMLLIDGKIPLDPLYEKMVIKINNKQIVLLPPKNTPNDILEKNT